MPHGSGDRTIAHRVFPCADSSSFSEERELPESKLLSQCGLEFGNLVTSDPNRLHRVRTTKFSLCGVRLKGDWPG